MSDPDLAERADATERSAGPSTRRGRAAAGVCIAAALPPWGWWPLAPVGIAVGVVLSGGAGAPGRFWVGWMVGVGWFAPSTLWMWGLTALGYAWESSSPGDRWSRPPGCRRPPIAAARRGSHGNRGVRVASFARAVRRRPAVVARLVTVPRTVVADRSHRRRPAARRCRGRARRGAVTRRWRTPLAGTGGVVAVLAVPVGPGVRGRSGNQDPRFGSPPCRAVDPRAPGLATVRHRWCSSDTSRPPGGSSRPRTSIWWCGPRTRST